MYVAFGFPVTESEMSGLQTIRRKTVNLESQTREGLELKGCWASSRFCPGFTSSLVPTDSESGVTF